MWLSISLSVHYFWAANIKYISISLELEIDYNLFEYSDPFSELCKSRLYVMEISSVAPNYTLTYLNCNM